MNLAHAFRPVGEDLEVIRLSGDAAFAEDVVKPFGLRSELRPRSIVSQYQCD